MSMVAHFHNRTEAGQLLAGQLLKYAGRTDLVVVAVSYGGVPVGCAVARFLDAPCAMLTLPKPRAPGHMDIVPGAIVINDDLVNTPALPPAITAEGSVQ